MTKIRYGRTFNLGNFETERIEVEQEYDELLKLDVIAGILSEIKDWLPTQSMEYQARELARKMMREGRT